jgi:HSP20 family molecular chaperone IbpA
MWDEALSQLERAECRQRRFFMLLRARVPAPVWEPPADVFESEDGLHIWVALPGARAEDVAVHFEAGELVVRTERPLPALDRVRIRRLEIPYGPFERRIELPAGRYSVRRTAIADGCLELHLARE